MTTTESLADVLHASDRLRETIIGKVGEIDQKVDKSISDLNAAFPLVYSKYTKLTHYMDAVNGNDDNDGLNWNNAVKTIKRALELGGGALQQDIHAAVGKYIVDEALAGLASTVNVHGKNQDHYPSGVYSESESSIIHFDKTDIATKIHIATNKHLFFNRFILTFEGNSESTSIDNTAFRNSGKLTFRLPLFVFDSVNRGIFEAANNSIDFSSFGAELPQFEGLPGYIAKGSGSTSIINLDRSIDRTSGFNMSSGTVKILT